MHICTHIFVCFIYILLLFDVAIFNPADEAEFQSSALLSHSLTLFSLKAIMITSRTCATSLQLE